MEHDKVAGQVSVRAELELRHPGSRQASFADGQERPSQSPGRRQDTPTPSQPHPNSGSLPLLIHPPLPTTELPPGDRQALGLQGTQPAPQHR